MNAVANMWRTDRSQLIGLAGVGIAIVVLLLNLGFFLRPGGGEVLGGLAHHAFVLGWMLLLTSGSRTVSLGTLGVFWLLGVWSVYVLAYLLESQLATLLGADTDGDFVSVWLAPFVEEATKLLPIAIFLLLFGRGGFRHLSMSDGMLLGFMIGAGVSFHEDAHYGDILVSGDGWGAAPPWTTVFPTISEVSDRAFALNHALWAALSGLSIGVAAMFRHRRAAWAIALIGPLLAVTNHVLVNYLVADPFRGAGRGDVGEPFSTLQNLTDGGRWPLLILIAGAVAVVLAEWLILRWVGKRDRLFPSLPIARIFALLARSTTKAGAAQLLSATRYLSLRRAVYFAGWRAKAAGGNPVVAEDDYAQLVSLALRLEALPPRAAQPNAAAPPGAPPATPAPIATPASDAAGGDAPPTG
jgi:RsiW-degrading membrane proteinase PrsW (M82 family)